MFPILNLVEYNTYIKEYSYKQGFIRTNSLNKIKIIFLLPTKIIAIYIKLSNIKF